MKVTVKKDLPSNLFQDRMNKAGKTYKVTHVVIDGQTWPIELIEGTK